MQGRGPEDKDETGTQVDGTVVEGGEGSEEEQTEIGVHVKWS